MSKRVPRLHSEQCNAQSLGNLRERRAILNCILGVYRDAPTAACCDGNGQGYQFMDFGLWMTCFGGRLVESPDSSQRTRALLDIMAHELQQWVPVGIPSCIMCVSPRL